MAQRNVCACARRRGTHRHGLEYVDPMTPFRISCDVAVGQPTDRVTLMVGNTGAVFVEGPSGLTATLNEANARAFAEIVLARVSAFEKTRRKP